MNAPALLLRTSVDQGADGTLDTITLSTYSSDNKILERVLDSNADGQADAVTNYTYNNSGDQTGLFFDNAADGSVDYSFTTDYATDANGILTITYTSSDGDGSDEVYVSKVDSAGNLIEEAVGTSDGGTEVTATYDYNSSGQLTAYTSSRGRTEYTYDASGRISGFESSTTIAEYTYDEAGNIVRTETDNPAFGSDSVETYTYDEENRLVRSNLSGSFSSGPGGGFSFETNYEYNAAGQITAFGSSGGVNGRNGGSSYTYDYDEAGNLIKESFRGSTFGGMLPSRVIEYSYDSAGRITSQRIDSTGVITPQNVDMGADGIFDSVTSYAYDDLLTGGAGQTLTAIAESGNAMEANIFADDSIAQVSFGTSDMFSSRELVSSDLLETSTFLEAEAGLAATDQLLM